MITTLRENERMMRTENVDDEHHALAVVESERGRNHSRRHDESREIKITIASTTRYE